MKISSIYDDKLFEERTLFLQGEITEESCDTLIKQLLLCHAEFEKNFVPLEKRIVKLCVSSMGGSVRAGLALISFLNSIPLKLKIVALNVASMAAVITCCCANGSRYIVNDGSVMVHQPSMETSGTIADAQIALEQGVILRTKINNLVAEATGQAIKEVEAAMSRDTWFDSQAALKWGLVDHIIDSAEVFQEVFNEELL